MKGIHFLELLFFFFYAIACGGKNDKQNVDNYIDTTLTPKVAIADTFQKGQVIGYVFCKADPTQSYALYIPSKFNIESLPVVYFFDPHGDGALPLNKYKSLAEEYGFIFIGSNNSKNGNDLATAENTWNAMFEDSRNRLSIKANRVYVCGFSGGAKVATSIALNHNQIKGVIANGAGSPEITNAGNFNFSFTAVAGEGDLNMTDLVAITNNLDNSKTRHRIIFFDGIHEWAPESTMNAVIAGLQLDAMEQNLIPRNDTFVNNYITESKRRITDYLNRNNYLKAEIACKFSTSVLSG
ncbi:MAG: PHB depolymerase family esterase, partial [Bacteroidota bacterium]|nr:PHB depolymerase family esterase [Bacteroidota bacterium]